MKQLFPKCISWKGSVCSEKELNVGEIADAFVQEGISSRMQLVQTVKRTDVSERVILCVAGRTIIMTRSCSKSVPRKMDIGQDDIPLK